MIYAKINEDGTVAEFPYRSRDTSILRPDQELPADVVEVDTETNKPSLKWDQKVSYDSVVKVDDKYVATYNSPESKFADADAKLKAITINKKMQEDSNERTFVFKSKELGGEYTDGERSSWNQQRTEAIAYTTDNTTATPLLSVIATARGITVAELAAKIVENAAAYDVAYGELLGKYQKNKDILTSIDLEDNTTWDSIDSIVRL